MKKRKLDPTAVKVGANMREVRDRLEMSRTYVGDIVGVSQQMIAKYEEGTAAVSATMLAKIADVLKCSVARFYR